MQLLTHSVIAPLIASATGKTIMVIEAVNSGSSMRYSSELPAQIVEADIVDALDSNGKVIIVLDGDEQSRDFQQSFASLILEYPHSCLTWQARSYNSKGRETHPRWHGA